MGFLGFRKNDYKMIEDQEDDSENENLSEGSQILYSDIVVRQDLAWELFNFLQDRAKELSIPVFDKFYCSWEMYQFLSNFDPSFEES